MSSSTAFTGDEFTGWVCWDVDEMFEEDILDGKEKRRSRKIEFGKIVESADTSVLPMDLAQLKSIVQALLPAIERGGARWHKRGGIFIARGPEFVRGELGDIEALELARRAAESSVKSATDLT